MIGPFALTAQGVCASIGRDYNLLIQQLIHEILVVLDDPGDFPMFLAAATGLENERAASVDPALEYLLPAMSLDSDEAARLRALTEDMLRAEKSERLRRICHELDSAISDGTHCVMLNEDEAWVWLAGFTDIRLALAGELRISSTDDLERVEELASEEPHGLHGNREQSAAAIYLLVTWWQDSLLKALREMSDSH